MQPRSAPDTPWERVRVPKPGEPQHSPSLPKPTEGLGSNPQNVQVYPRPRLLGEESPGPSDPHRHLQGQARSPLDSNSGTLLVLSFSLAP
jgi:hypothetical protein